MPKITKVEFTSFAYKLEGLTVDEGHNTVYKPGGVVNRTGLAVRIFDSDGVEGSFVYPSPESAMVAQAKSLAQAADRPRSECAREDVRRHQAHHAQARRVRLFAARHRAVGHGRQALRRLDHHAARRLPRAPADVCQHLSRRPQRRALQQGGVRRLRRILLRAAASVPSRSTAGP